MSEERIQLRTARTADDIASAGELFREYIESLNIDIEHQGWREELAHLPGPYKGPGGVILLASLNGMKGGKHDVGCVALRPLDEDGVCEMKRLYVRPDARGKGIGRLMVERIIQAGQAFGYETMKLDTSEDMTEARKLYESLGFTECEKYNDDPLECTMFFERSLSE